MQLFPFITFCQSSVFLCAPDVGGLIWPIIFDYLEYALLKLLGLYVNILC